jgi:GNAT superfamily N-acetyltransferase
VNENYLKHYRVPLALLVHPDYQGKGIGQMIMENMQKKYRNFHMQMLTADGRAIDFYKKVGFVRAGQTESMWIYNGDEH